MNKDVFFSTKGVEGLFINFNNIALIIKSESSQGEWLNIFFNNGESTTIYNADRELWNALIKETTNGS